MDEASNSVVHDDCWETHLKKTMEEPLNRGILEVGRLWSHFARHQRKRKSCPRSTDTYSPPHDPSFNVHFADIQEAYLPDDQSTEGHLYTKRSEAEVQRLFWSARFEGTISSRKDKVGR